MEFSYRISEDDFVGAWMMQRGSSRKSPIKAIILWIFIFAGLMALWSWVLSRSYHLNVDSSAHVATSSQDLPVKPSLFPDSPRTALKILSPFLAFLAIWLVLVIWVYPRSLRRLYENDPAVRSEITVNITPEWFSSHDTAGAITRNPWSRYKRWIEKENLILLVMHSRPHVILNTAGLSEIQKRELRGILSTVLPQK